MNVKIKKKKKKFNMNNLIKWARFFKKKKSHYIFFFTCVTNLVILIKENGELECYHYRYYNYRQMITEIPFMSN
jgi:hypothetical protein